METIYIDSLFLINLAVNYLILLATARLCGLPLRRIRLGLGAALGAVYAVLTVLPQTAFLAGAPVKLACAVAMLLAAFGSEKRLLRIAVVFFAVSAAFGGAVFAVSLLGGGTGTGKPFVPVSARVLILSFAVSYTLITLVFRGVGKRGERKLHKIELELNGGSAALTALRDTGNTLCDPVSGFPVMVAEAKSIEPLFSTEGQRELSRCTDPVELLVALGRSEGTGRFRLIPYSAVGVESGVLLCFRPDTVRVDGRRERELLVAISQTGLCGDGEYVAII